MGGGDAEGPVVVRHDLGADRKCQRRPTEQLVAGQAGPEEVVRRENLAVEPRRRSEEPQPFGRTCLQAGFQSLGARLGDIVGLEADRIEVDELAEVVAEGHERPGQGAGDAVLVAQAEFEARVALGAEGEIEVRAVGEVVRRRRTVSRADLGVSQQFLGEAAAVGDIARGLTGEVRETVRADRGADAVLGRGLPFGARPEAEAFLRLGPRKAVRGDVELVEGGAFVAQAESEAEVRTDASVDDRGEFVAVEQVAIGERDGEALDRGTRARPEDGSFGVFVLKAQARRKQPAAVALPVGEVGRTA